MACRAQCRIVQRLVRRPLLLANFSVTSSYSSASWPPTRSSPTHMIDSAHVSTLGHAISWSRHSSLLVAPCFRPLRLSSRMRRFCHLAFVYHARCSRFVYSFIFSLSQYTILCVRATGWWGVCHHENRPLTSPHSIPSSASTRCRREPSLLPRSARICALCL